MKGRIRFWFRNTLIAGLVAVLPLFLTVWFLNFLFKTLDRLLSPSVSPVIVRFVRNLGYPLQPGIKIPGIGILATILFLFLVGLFVRNFIGRRIVDAFEKFILRIPFAGAIMSSTKQFISFFVKKKAFSRVVMVEYPRKDSFVLAFLTGPVESRLTKVVGRKMSYLFIPTTPNPTSGFLLLVPDEDIIPLDISVEEGVKIIMSAGVLSESKEDE